MIRDPDFVAASTTIVIVESAAMMRLRAGKHQRWAVKPGGISDTTAPAAISRAWSPRIRAGYAVSAPPASTATGARRRRRRRGAVGDRRRRGHASSAPACAAESIPSAMPDTTGSPADGETTAERARDLEPVRRGPARADDRDGLAARQRGERPGDVEDGRRVGQLAQALRVARAGSDRRRSGRRRAIRRRAAAASKRS